MERNKLFQKLLIIIIWLWFGIVHGQTYKHGVYIKVINKNQEPIKTCPITIKIKRINLLNPNINYRAIRLLDGKKEIPVQVDKLGEEKGLLKDGYISFLADVPPSSEKIYKLEYSSGVLSKEYPKTLWVDEEEMFMANSLIKLELDRVEGIYRTVRVVLINGERTVAGGDNFYGTLWDLGNNKKYGFCTVSTWGGGNAIFEVSKPIKNGPIRAIWLKKKHSRFLPNVITKEFWILYDKNPVYIYRCEFINRGKKEIKITGGIAFNSLIVSNYLYNDTKQGIRDLDVTRYIHITWMRHKEPWVLRYSREEEIGILVMPLDIRRPPWDFSRHWWFNTRSPRNSRAVFIDIKKDDKTNILKPGKKIVLSGLVNIGSIDKPEDIKKMVNFYNTYIKNVETKLFRKIEE